MTAAAAWGEVEAIEVRADAHSLRADTGATGEQLRL